MYKHTTMPTVSASTGHSNALAAPTMQTLRDGHNRLNIAWAAWRSSAEDARFAAVMGNALPSKPPAVSRSEVDSLINDDDALQEALSKSLLYNTAGDASDARELAVVEGSVAASLHVMCNELVERRLRSARSLARAIHDQLKKADSLDEAIQSGGYATKKTLKSLATLEAADDARVEAECQFSGVMAKLEALVNEYEARQHGMSRMSRLSSTCPAILG